MNRLLGWSLVIMSIFGSFFVHAITEEESAKIFPYEDALKKNVKKSTRLSIKLLGVDDDEIQDLKSRAENISRKLINIESTLLYKIQLSTTPDRMKYHYAIVLKKLKVFQINHHLSFLLAENILSYLVLDPRQRGSLTPSQHLSKNNKLRTIDVIKFLRGNDSELLRGVSYTMASEFANALRGTILTVGLRSINTDDSRRAHKERLNAVFNRSVESLLAMSFYVDLPEGLQALNNIVIEYPVLKKRINRRISKYKINTKLITQFIAVSDCAGLIQGRSPWLPYAPVLK